jgi:hypothetical protein
MAQSEIQSFRYEQSIITSKVIVKNFVRDILECDILLVGKNRRNESRIKTTYIFT